MITEQKRHNLASTWHKPPYRIQAPLRSVTLITDRGLVGPGISSPIGALIWQFLPGCAQPGRCKIIHLPGYAQVCSKFHIKLKFARPISHIEL